MSDQNTSVTEAELKKALGLSIGRKSVLLAYVLWFFLGGLGVHRMYLGKVASGVFMAILSIVGTITSGIGIGLILLLVVFVWWIWDAISIFLSARRHNAIHDTLTK